MFPFYVPLTFYGMHKGVLKTIFFFLMFVLIFVSIFFYPEKIMSGISVQHVARAMVKDAVSRVRPTDQSNTGHKIYSNADIYAFNGLGSNGKPPKQ